MKSIWTVSIIAGILFLAVLVPSLAFDDVLAVKLSKVISHGSLTDVVYNCFVVPDPNPTVCATGNPRQPNLDEDTTGPWKVRAWPDSDEFVFSAVAKTTRGDVHTFSDGKSSVVADGGSVSEADGVLTITKARLVVTTDGANPFDICGQIVVDNNAGTMELDVNECDIGFGPTGFVNLNGDVKKYKT